VRLIHFAASLILFIPDIISLTIINANCGRL
jgi:hypothetical protein